MILSTIILFGGVDLNWYNWLGALNAALIVVSLVGVFSQLRTIWLRKHAGHHGERPTALLSLNQFTVSFFAYLSFFIYGYAVEPFNHYIVWPRLLASLIVAHILLEIWRDRQTVSTLASVSIAAVGLLLAITGLLTGEAVVVQGKVLSTAIIIAVSVCIAQGYYHQIRLIISAGHTGAIDRKMSLYILLMDISTIAFALTMGFEEGWPLLVLAVTSGITKIIILYLFRWVSVSPVAAQRRQANTPGAAVEREMA